MMQVISQQILKNFFIQPLQKSSLQSRFKVNEVIRGKIVEALPKENSFILHTKGLNLVASTRIALFVGDTIVGKILNNKEKIELKLSEVNGKVMHQNVSLAEDGVNFTRIPLPENAWGREAFVEIYPDRDSGKQEKEGESWQQYHLIISSEKLQHIVMDVKLRKAFLMFNVWLENQALYRFIKSKTDEISSIIKDDKIEEVELQVMPLGVEVKYFRRKWMGETNLDIRA